MILREYLLGLLNENKQNELEERYFTDDGYFELILAAENELVEDYICGKLSRQQRKRFDQYLLPNPKWQQKVANVRALQHAINEDREQVSAIKTIAVTGFIDRMRELISGLFEQRVIIGLSYAAVLLFIIFSGAWIVRQFQYLQTQVDNLKAKQSLLIQEDRNLRQQLKQQTDLATEFAAKFEQEMQQRLKLQQMLDKIKPQPMQMLAFSLEPGILRDTGEQKKLNVPPTAQSIQLELIIDSDVNYTGYAATIKTVEGVEAWSKTGFLAKLTDWGSTIILDLPAIVLTNNDYILTLKGIPAQGIFEIIHNYFFSVSRN